MDSEEAVEEEEEDSCDCGACQWCYDALLARIEYDVQLWVDWWLDHAF